MIESDQQYRITKEWMVKFARALDALKKSPVDKAESPIVRQMQEAALSSQLADLKAEIAEWESKGC